MTGRPYSWFEVLRLTLRGLRHTGLPDAETLARYWQVGPRRQARIRAAIEQSHALDCPHCGTQIPDGQMSAHLISGACPAPLTVIVDNGTRALAQWTNPGADVLDAARQYMLGAGLSPGPVDAVYGSPGIGRSPWLLDLLAAAAAEEDAADTLLTWPARTNPVLAALPSEPPPGLCRIHNRDGCRTCWTDRG